MKGRWKHFLICTIFILYNYYSIQTAALRNYILTYLTSRQNMENYVREQMILVLAIMTKRQFVDGDGTIITQMLNDLSQLIMSDNNRLQVRSLALFSSQLPYHSYLRNIFFKSRKQNRICGNVLSNKVDKLPPLLLLYLGCRLFSVGGTFERVRLVYTSLRCGSAMGSASAREKAIRKYSSATHIWILSPRPHTSIEHSTADSNRSALPHPEVPFARWTNPLLELPLHHDAASEVGAPIWNTGITLVQIAEMRPRMSFTHLTISFWFYLWYIIHYNYYLSFHIIVLSLR